MEDCAIVGMLQTEREVKMVGFVVVEVIFSGKGRNLNRMT